MSLKPMNKQAIIKDALAQIDGGTSNPGYLTLKTN